MVLWLAWGQVYKVGLSTLPKRSFVSFLSEGFGIELWQTQTHGKVKWGFEQSHLHTSFTLRMQSSIASNGLLSEVLPASLMDKQEIPTRQLGKGVPGLSTILLLSERHHRECPWAWMVIFSFPFVYWDKYNVLGKIKRKILRGCSLPWRSKWEDRCTAVDGKAQPGVLIWNFSDIIKMKGLWGSLLPVRLRICGVCWGIMGKLLSCGER